MTESIKHPKTDSPANAAELQLELGIKKAQLKWLLQITHAINYNFSNVQLLEIFEKVLKEECHLSNYALFYFHKKWKCILICPEDKNIKSLAEKITAQLNTTGKFDKEKFSEWTEIFELLTPVSHEKHQLAYLFTSGYDNKGRKTRNELIKFVETINNLIVVAMENNNFKTMREEQIAMKIEMDMAAQMQMLLIPDILPQHEGMECEKLYLPHKEVGGDYLDLIQLSEHEFVFCIGDAMGKGMPAAMLMSNFQANLQALLPQKLSLTQIIETLNSNIFKLTRGERYITFFIGRFDMRTRELQYFNAGHPPPVMLHMNVPLNLDSGSTFLGSFEKLPEMKAGKTYLPSPSLILCFTDGITDARNSSDESFGTERVFDFLFSGVQAKSLNEIHRDLLLKIDAFRKDEPHHDDITLLSLRFK
ncbi:MAG TPA: PP2C family protein-serine/threonine phosphatase [Bacteroidia bacterium]|nr:PP2C family protein-serine/threonine phosphatase [Bacteroidia bacterium]